jgi:tetratricopeptide (TPR) repeat protein
MRRIWLLILFGVIILGSITLSCFGVSPFLGQLHVARGVLLLGQGQYEKATAVLSQAIESDSEKIQAYVIRSRLYLDQQLFDLALADADKALAIQPTSQAFEIKAFIYYQRGQLDEALENVNTALAIIPVSANACAIRALIEFEKQDYYKVLKDCNMLVLLDPKRVIAYRLRGLVHAKAAQIDSSELEKAIANFSKAIELMPTDQETYYNRALAYENQGDTAKAISDYNMVISLAQDPTVVQLAEEKLAEMRQ